MRAHDLPEIDNETLAHALHDIVLHPGRNLVAAWNWKAAAISALLRAALFFATNIHTHALKAMLVEAGFAIAAAGLMGAVTQRLRATRPVGATAFVVWLGMPLLMFAAQLSVHRAFGTEHLRAGLIASFCFASVASGFNWFAQRRGVMLSGAGNGTVDGDLRALPRVILEFVLAGPRALLR